MPYARAMRVEPAVVDWLLDADPAIRWQVLRDLLEEPERVWSAERAKVATEGWGARLLAVQDDDGLWAGGAHFPRDFAWPGPETFQGPGKPWLGEGQPWTSTSHVLSQLRELGLDPGSPAARRTVELVGVHGRWEYDDLPYWGGEVEPCINGTLVANGSYLGVDMTPVVERLVGEALADGGWNCEAERGSVRSSFHTTIAVLEGLLEHEVAGRGTEASRAARRGGEAYLLERHLFRRRSTGEPADPQFLRFVHPDRYFYSVLRGLEHFRRASLATGAAPDPRLAEAVAHVRARRRDDGRWDLDWTPAGRTWFAVDDGPGRPSRWITLKALRVLAWWDARS